MRTGGLKKALEHLRLADGGLTDGQLLARFLDGRDEEAFTALVRRHGPMVLGVCRRVLGHLHDAEDAFQAAFLLLARKASSVINRQAVSGWLYRVAYRTALEARAKALRRKARERQVDEMPHPEVAPTEAQDWRPLLDRELDLLPEKFRTAVVLCDLEGKTRRDAARLLSVSEGTVSSRLARARCLLARRLSRHGLTLSGGALAAALAEGASAAVPASWVSSTAQAAVQIAAGQAAAVATPAAALMNEVAKAMLMTKLKFGLLGLMVVGLLGASGLVYQAAAQPLAQPAGQAPMAAKPVEPKALSELELLRREVEILKMQMEVMQAELRTLKGKAGGAGQHAPAQPYGAVVLPPGGLVAGPQAAPCPAPAVAPGPAPAAGDAAPLPRQPQPAVGAAVPTLPQVANPTADRLIKQGIAPLPAASDAEKDVEAALHALKNAPDNESKQRAVAALEKALKKLRQQLKPASTNTTPRGT
jgi:RNA polymerase sigma factor (sigma-70 family)